MSDIETIFIRKFTEKFTLNERGLKKAFSRFVTNENGQLGIDEIENFFKLFLNGFDANDIKQFVLKYDLNGDGQISYLELLDLLKGKKSKKKQNQNVSNDLDATKGSVQIEKSFNKPLKDNETENMTKINRDIERIRLSKSSESSDDIQVNNTDSIDNLVQEYIRNLKSYLMKLCSSRIQDREKKGASGLTQTAPQHTATLVKELLDKEFQPYTGLGDGRVRHTLGTGVTFNDFSK
jgi:Ca2+-binding EF-hand superfamily protein